MFGNKRNHTAFARREFAERVEAQKIWPFLTSRDLDKVRTEQDLCTVIRSNTGAGSLETAAAVRSWMTGHFARLGSAYVGEYADLGANSPGDPAVEDET